MNIIHDFTFHNGRGQSILASDLLRWKSKYPYDENLIFGPIAKYTWTIGNDFCQIINSNNISLSELPDCSGFICFEEGSNVDNCTILDEYGRLKYRLAVPFRLTGKTVPQGAEMWFRNVGDHKEGRFGVTAWIEYAGDYYFELDYQVGKFLWGKEIRF